MKSLKSDSPRGIRLVVSPDDPDVAYLYLPDHPGPGSSAVSSRQIRLADLVLGYSGPDLVIDLDQDGRAIGVEVLV